MASVSVVIPTYKASVFIRGTLASVFAQTRLPDEVIVVDDCSPDDTVALVEEIAKTAPVPMRVIRLEKNSGGPAKPLNVGVEAARGDLIATLDHDDLMLADKVERQVAAFTLAPDLGLVFHRCRLDGPPTEWLGSFIATTVEPFLCTVPKANIGPECYRINKLHAYAGLLEGNYTLTCSNLMIPKSVWRQVGGISTRFRINCDYHLMQKVTIRWDIGFISSSLITWRRHDGVLSNSAAERSNVENWELACDFRMSLLSSAGRRRLAEYRRSMDDSLLGTIYRLRAAGRRNAALAVCLRQLHRRPSLRAVLATGKSAALTLVKGGGPA